MEKPLSDSQHKDDTVTQETNANAHAPETVIHGAIPSGNSTSFGGYATKITAPLQGLSTKDWIKSENTAWASTPQGRIAIRAFSRGVLGAAFFAAGGLFAEKCMNDNAMFGAERYDSTKGFSEQKNTLQVIAKGIDTFVGKPIEWTVGALSGDKFLAQRAVRFRPTKHASNIKGVPDGRSLGAEVVSVTFDFFSASIGDAMGRDLASLLDPNTKKPWYDKDGHFSPAEAVKSAAKSAFRYVTYNGGEDWAVAIPYVYFMKAQRSVIDHCSPGFKYDFDRGVSGGSFKVNNNLKVTGSYGLEGAIDLQTRFTVYNIGTLMYRELYNHVGNLLQGKQSALYGSPEDVGKEPRSLLQQLGDLGKWAARSAVKGTIYMTPSVPFFWITRSAQSKHRGTFINPEKGILEHLTDGRMQSLYVYELDKNYQQGLVPQGDELFYGNHTGGKWHPEIPTNTFANPFDSKFDPYKQGGNIVDRAFDKIGGWHTKMDAPIAQVGQAMDEFITTNDLDGYRENLGIKVSSKFLTRAANAAISYTPYMASKAEFANMWDDGKMDMAAERMINGATSLNWGEFKAGAGEVYNSILRRPLKDPEREKEAQHRIELDSSAPVSFVQTKGQRRAAREAVSRESPTLSWQDRMVSGKQEAHTAQDHLNPDSRPRSYAENEAMKKALEELSPPTNAIH